MLLSVEIVDNYNNVNIRAVIIDGRMSDGFRVYVESRFFIVDTIPSIV